MIENFIVQRVFEYFGIIENNKNQLRLMDDANLQSRKLSIDYENDQSTQMPLWGVSGKIGNSKIRALAANIGEQNDELIKEVILIFQLDDLTEYALIADIADKSFKGRAYAFNEGSNWFQLSNLLLAKMLVGIEQLDEMIVIYSKLENIDDLYKSLISFLNYEEVAQNT